MLKFLTVQTAFIGDVILATPVIERLRSEYPDAQIDFMLRKGNEGLLTGHPHINELLVWDKKKGKYKELLRILKLVRKEKYDYVINLQRFASSGIFTALSKAKIKVGFDKNPFSFLFQKKVPHSIGNGVHEVERNQELLEGICTNKHTAPKLYPLKTDIEKVIDYSNGEFVCMAPASVWFTKQLPIEQWIKLVQQTNKKFTIYLLGAPGDKEMAESIIQKSGRENVVNLCGSLNLLQSAALMKDAKMNYVNDSAPMHLASSVNAPVTAFFCSTVSSFGFGPLSTESVVAEVEEALECRPCGLHGKKECPKQHFKCGYDISIEKFVI
ncbi:MAG: glycosyltransferase family 9 protein [Bacteroidales bacterium]|nr:glycosyltransferase family 9 protein [Bacteroidales bacterium]